MKKALNKIHLFFFLLVLFFSPSKVDSTQYYVTDAGGNAYRESATSPYLASAAVFAVVLLSGMVVVALQNSHNTHSH